jgi:hypothetical protein
MRFRRKLPVLFGFLLFVAAVAMVIVLRKHAPPEAARLLPGADAYVYVDLKWMRRADIAKDLPAVAHDPEYEQFIQATGFQFERDLQEAALAVHSTGGGMGLEARFTELFVAKIDGDRLRDYLKHLASSVETYRGIMIYNIPLQARIVRVAILGVNMVAVSNHPDPAIIRGIIDRSRKIASPFGGPVVLRQFYKHVPLASLVWGVFRVPSATASAPQAEQTLYGFPVPAGATIVTSIRYLGAVHFRAEAFTPDEQAAERLTGQVNAFLSIFRSAEVSVAGQSADPDIKKALDSLKVSQHKDRTVLTATVPVELIRKLVAEAPAEVGPRGPR